jgi:hypothetical protein
VNGIKIEVSNDAPPAPHSETEVFVNLSLVDGYSLPIVCHCGHKCTGCSKNLFQLEITVQISEAALSASTTPPRMDLRNPSVSPVAMMLLFIPTRLAMATRRAYTAAYMKSNAVLERGVVAVGMMLMEPLRLPEALLLRPWKGFRQLRSVNDKLCLEEGG